MKYKGFRILNAGLLLKIEFSLLKSFMNLEKTKQTTLNFA